MAALVASALAPAGAFEYPETLTSANTLLVAYDAQSGARGWRLRSEESGQLRVFAGTRQRVLTQVERCRHFDRDAREGDWNLVVFDAHDGKEAWRRRDVVVVDRVRGYPPFSEEQ